MSRNRNTRGGNFDAATIQAVWEKGKVIPDYSPATWRWDTCGAVMKRSEHGNTDSKHGWEVDHINPVSNDGSDALSNLQPLQWGNNRHKGDNYPNWSCKNKAA